MLKGKKVQPVRREKLVSEWTFNKSCINRYLVKTND